MIFRVLHIVACMDRGGLETMIMNYYRNIDREKLQFDFLVHSDNAGEYADEIKQLGGRIYHVSAMNPFSMKYRNQLKQFFITHSEYLVIHAHMNCMSAVVLRVAKEVGVPVRIAHSHNTNEDFGIKYFIKMYYKRKINLYATDRFACGEKAGRWLFGNEDFKLIRNAIDLKSFVYSDETRKKARFALGIEENELVIGHVGRFADQKNHEFILDIFGEIQKRFNSKLILIGDGEKKNSILQKIRSLDITEKVMLLGVRDDVEKIMQAFDVFLFPSKYEGLPVTLIEAQAAGLPCVISDTISREAILSEIVHVNRLSDSVTVWADSVEAAGNTIRKDASEIIRQHGYDIQEQAKILECFYLEKMKKL